MGFCWLFLSLALVVARFTFCLCGCNDLFLRYSENHTLCLKPSNSCEIQIFGVDNQTKKLIVDVHNQYRSLIAQGKEKRNSMPPAANMLQLEWDDDLAEVAQAHADQCVFEHDCAKCRKIENFRDVGQNLCLDKTTRKNPQPNWEACIKRWYEEVAMFPNENMDPFHMAQETGHFTQMVWATTWKIGCGFTRYPSSTPPFRYDLLYTCNYGPSGNVLGSSMYENGTACSHCPKGTCCNATCEEYNIQPDYKGLCKVVTDEGPSPDVDIDRLLWACYFNNETEDACATEENPSNVSAVRHTLASGYKTVTLEAGKTFNMTFNKTAFGARQEYCIKVGYTKGPSLAGEVSNHTLMLMVTSPVVASFRWDIELTSEASVYQVFSASLGVYFPIKVGFSFSVPEGAADQYFDLYKIEVKNSYC